ncbi:MAG: YcgN family cysteine cluster protein [Halopseudomonas sp.]
MSPAQPFWLTKSLLQMSSEEWESLCDGCGKCCLHKIEDEDTQELLYTRIACRQLDLECVRCRDYGARFKAVPECLNVRDMPVEQYRWLPVSCAYRLLAESQPLPDWHPLMSGDPQSVIDADISIIKWAVSEADVSDDEWFDHVLEGVEV